MMWRRNRELEEERAEHHQFRTKWLAEREQYRTILSGILDEHAPVSVPVLGEVRVELRCRRCHTDEHHTWATDNYMPWPCPTVAPLIQLAAALDGQPYSRGGYIPPRRTDPDSVMVRLSPGYVSYDGGRTWHERR